MHLLVRRVVLPSSSISKRRASLDGSIASRSPSPGTLSSSGLFLVNGSCETVAEGVVVRLFCRRFLASNLGMSVFLTVGALYLAPCDKLVSL